MKAFVNGRSVVHQGDGLTNTCPAPDVCKTPSPGGPVPVPYVNIAKDSDLANGSTSVEIEGHSIALANSYLSTSTGDEPGTAGGGLISAKTKGRMSWASSSIDVKVEGRGVVRFMDICRHNGNADNTGGEPQLGGGYMGSYPNTDEPVCPHCGKPMADHPPFDIPQTQESRDKTARMIAALESGYGQGIQKPGNRRGKMVGVLITDCPGPPPHQDTYAAVSGPPSNPATPQPLDGWEDVARAAGFKPSVYPDGFVNLPSSKPITVKRKNGGNEPGNCAAQKLIQQAAKRGCSPLAMTEAWCGGSKSGHTHNHSIESCDSCKLAIPQMLCAAQPST
ncbi:DUF4150 domain-containing protein [Archangium violaceum]|uniref:DUF4150 domain-containing protein n=1 Tax=Archangium violaceum TaxID=83451 RepID=UPI00193C4172|nr:DUF4150 domain-containing protein [Archangium violaceum]QRK11303.1 DUF4150 domain-containing protein [Archangium violaceum]